MRFTIDDKHLIKWMWVEKYVEKRLLKMFLTEDEVLMGKDTNENRPISARSLTLLIFAVCGQVDHNPNNAATAVIFSVKCFNQLKLYYLSENILRKRFASYFLYFIDERLIIDLQR